MGPWFIFAVGAAVFAALTTILAKIGLKNVDSNVVTAIRTIVVLVFAWIMVFVVGSQSEIRFASERTWVFLILSGLAAGCSWLCYFRALQLGDVSRVVPIDKSSTVLTMLLAFALLGEPMGVLTVIGMVFIGAGMYFMLDLKKEERKEGQRSWLFFAVLAAVFASLTAIFGKVGMAEIDAYLGIAIRTVAVLPLSWLVVFLGKSHTNIGKIDRKSWCFILLSGVATGVSWLFFYRALQLGDAIHVVPVDRLSILLIMVFARLFLGERFSKRSLVGLAFLTAGVLLPVLVPVVFVPSS